MKFLQKWREATIITKLQAILKDEDNNKMFRYMALNGIKSNCSIMVLNNKISEEFYRDIFYHKDANCYKHWSDLNREKILHYYE